MTCSLSMFSVLIFSFVYLGQVAAFSFEFNPPSECDDLGLKWSGGSPPFKLSIIPVFGAPREVPIPDSAFKDGKGSFSTPMTMPKDQKVVLSMSDSTGFNSGGATEVLTVASSKGGSCNSAMPSAAFFFQLNSALQQCRPFTFEGYTGATQPVTINALVPGGTGIELKPPTGPTSFQWVANIPKGTSVLFIMTDAQGRTGGSSDLRLVGDTNDVSCLNNQSPSSTSKAPGSSSTGKPSSTNSSTSSSSPSSSSGVSGGAVAGGIIGGILFLAIVVTLVLFYLKKKRNDQGGLLGGPQRQKLEDIDGPTTRPMHPPNTASAAPYPYTPNTAQTPYLDNSPAAPRTAQQSQGGAYRPPSDDPYMSNAQYPQADNPFNQIDGQYQAAQAPLYPYQQQPPSHPAPGSLYPPSAYQNAPVQYRHQPGSSQDLASERPVSQYQASESGASSSQFSSTLPYLRNSTRPPSSLYPPSSAPYGGVSSASDPFRTNPPSNAGSGEFDPYATQSQGSGSQSAALRKAAMAGASQQPGSSRFILHTDAEDAYPPPPDDEEVVELPPQYTERRGGPVRLDPPSGLPAGTPYKS